MSYPVGVYTLLDPAEFVLMDPGSKITANYSRKNRQGLSRSALLCRLKAEERGGLWAQVVINT